jgi:hypothetical protein
MVNLLYMACDIAKSMKIPFTDPQKRGEHVGEVIWCNLGSIKPISINGRAYFALITEDLSHHRDFRSLKTKDEVQDLLIGYIKQVVAKLGDRSDDQPRRRLKTVRIDGGLEFSFSKLRKVCNNEAVAVVLFTPYNQYQNIVPERGIRFLQDEARAVTIQCKIPTCFWDRMCAAVCHILNRTGQSSVGKLTPQEVYNKEFSSKPDDVTAMNVRHLRIIGSRCVAHIDANERIIVEKLSARGASALFLGYNGTHNYVVWLIEGSRYLRTPHVVFHKNTGDLSEAPNPRDIVRSLPPHVQRRLRHRPKPTKEWIKDADHNIVNEDVTDKNGQVVRRRGRPKKKKVKLYQCVLEAPEEHPKVFQAFQQKGEDQNGVFDSFSAQRLRKLIFSDVCMAEHVMAYGYNEILRLMELATDTPTYKEAITGPEREQWLAAIFTKIRKNLDRGTFEFVDPNQHQGHLVDSKWVLKKKYTSIGELEKYKARICAKGFTQRFGMDYEMTKATIARAPSWRILLALAAIRG